MDILHDKPIIPKSKGSETASGLPYYVSWLASGKQRPSLLQKILVKTLEAQLRSDTWMNGVRAWFTYLFTIAETCAEYAFYTVEDTVRLWRSQLTESSLFQSGREAKMPVHSK
jgi:flagellar motor protein MotB